MPLGENANRFIYWRKKERRVCLNHWAPLFFSSSSKVGSPSALSDPDLNQQLRQAAQQYGNTLYVPSGALWGGQDIQRLNDSGGLKVNSGSAGVDRIR